MTLLLVGPRAVVEQDALPYFALFRYLLVKASSWWNEQLRKLPFLSRFLFDFKMFRLFLCFSLKMQVPGFLMLRKNKLDNPI